MLVRVDGSSGTKVSNFPLMASLHASTALGNKYRSFAGLEMRSRVANVSVWLSPRNCLYV